MAPLNEPLRILLDESEAPVPSPEIIYLLWVNTDVINTYGTATNACRAVEEYCATHPGNWFEYAHWHWCELTEGDIWRLQIDPRQVIAALPVIHADVATSDPNEAL